MSRIPCASEPSWGLADELRTGRGYSQRLLRQLHYILNPERVGWPKAFGAKPSLPEEYASYPASASFLTSIAPDGFYEACLIGPDEDQREGWITHQNAENGDLTFKLPTLAEAERGDDKGWTYGWVYASEIEAMIPVLSRIAKKKLEDTPVEEGLTVIRPDPASPGVIPDYAGYHWAAGIRWGRPSIHPPSSAIGVRLYPSSSSPEKWTEDQPLVLFTPAVLTETEIAITLTHDLVPAAIPSLISALAQVDGESIRSWGLEKDDVFVEELVKRGGKFEYRIKPDYPVIPCGVAWYGPKGTNARIDGLEFWAMM